MATWLDWDPIFGRNPSFDVSMFSLSFPSDPDKLYCKTTASCHKTYKCLLSQVAMLLVLEIESVLVLLPLHSKMLVWLWFAWKGIHFNHSKSQEAAFTFLLQFFRKRIFKSSHGKHLSSLQPHEGHDQMHFNGWWTRNVTQGEHTCEWVHLKTLV